jgi:hypothetical protein
VTKEEQAVIDAVVVMQSRSDVEPMPSRLRDAASLLEASYQKWRLADAQLPEVYRHLIIGPEAPHAADRSQINCFHNGTANKSDECLARLVMNLLNQRGKK